MKLTEILGIVGDDNLNVQFVDECTSSIQATKKTGNRLVVHTDEAFGAQGMERFGVVVWMERDKWTAAVHAAQAAAKGAGDAS